MWVIDSLYQVPVKGTIDRKGHRRCLHWAVSKAEGGGAARFPVQMVVQIACLVGDDAVSSLSVGECLLGG